MTQTTLYDESSIGEFVCERCGKFTLSYVPDPYMLEIHNEEVLTWLCDECQYEVAMDI